MCEMGDPVFTGPQPQAGPAEWEHELPAGGERDLRLRIG